MYNLLRKTDIGAILALIILSVVLQLHSFLHTTPLLHEAIPSFISTHVFERFQQQHPIIVGVVLYLIIAFLCIQVNYVMIREKMMERKSFITAFSFVWVATLLKIETFWNPAFISSICIWLALSEIMSISMHKHPRKILFRSGALCALAILLFLPSILFVLLFLILIAFFRPFSISEYSAWIIGLLTPIYLGYLSSWVFDLPIPSLKQVLGLLHLPVHIQHPVFSLTSAALTLLIVVYSWYVYHQQNSKFPIGVRKKWNAVAFYLVVAVLCGGFNKTFPGSAWTVILFPFCILLSLALQSNKQKVNIFTFYFIISALLVMQWALSK